MPWPFGERGEPWIVLDEIDANNRDLRLEPRFPDSWSDLAEVDYTQLPEDVLNVAVKLKKGQEVEVKIEWEQENPTQPPKTIAETISYLYVPEWGVDAGKLPIPDSVINEVPSGPNYEQRKEEVIRKYRRKHGHS